MNTRILSALIMTALCGSAVAAPKQGLVQKAGVYGTVWQEPLKLQSEAGEIELSVADFKGLLLTYERQWLRKSRGFAVGGFVGAGQASGGGTSTNAGLNYKGSSVPFTVAAIQPRYVWGLNEFMDVSVAVAALARTIEWPESPTVRITTSRSLNAVLSFDLDLNFAPNVAFRQSYGFWSLDVGPFWKWGLLAQW